eukprot:Pgem_evm1s3396
MYKIIALISAFCVVSAVPVHVQQHQEKHVWANEKDIATYIRDDNLCNDNDFNNINSGCREGSFCNVQVPDTKQPYFIKEEMFFPIYTGYCTPNCNGAVSCHMGMFGLYCDYGEGMNNIYTTYKAEMTKFGTG